MNYIDTSGIDPRLRKAKADLAAIDDRLHRATRPKPCKTCGTCPTCGKVAAPHPFHPWSAYPRTIWSSS